MRKKTLGGVRASPASSPKAPHTTVRAIPLLDMDSEAVPKTSIQSKHDIRNVRDVASKENVNNGINAGSNVGSHDSLGHEYISIDMDRRVCISCDEGGEVLVCSERDCPITVHGKCICIEPKFDDNGNFYCPYCWLKRALAEVQEMRNKALAAKKNLSSFLDKRAITSDNQAKYGEAKRTEPEELSLVGNENLEYCNRKGNDNVHSQPWQTVEENQKETEVIASADQDGIPVEGEAYANTQVADSCDSRYSEEKTPVHNDLIPKYTNREEFNVRNISEIYETRSAEGKGGIEQEEEAEPSSASHLEKYTTGDSTDIPFVKRKRESVAVSVDNNDSTKDREKVLQNETMVPAIDSSVSESHDAASEAPLVKKRRMTQRVQKYPQRVSSVSEPLPLNKSIDGQNSCHENEEVTSSKTLRQRKVSSNQGRSKKLTLPAVNRRKLRWTVEEENMLKEGVQRFATENSCMPWVKILEFGSHVFDNTRTPVDLKDKWRNLTAKEG